MNCEIKPLCYPKAALFCFASALLMYNAFAVMTAAIAAEHGRQKAELLSHDDVASEIAEATDEFSINAVETHVESTGLDDSGDPGFRT